MQGYKSWLLGPKQTSSNRPFPFGVLHGVWSAKAVVRPALWLSFPICWLLLPALPPAGGDRALSVNIPPNGISESASWETHPGSDLQEQLPGLEYLPMLALSFLMTNPYF